MVRNVADIYPSGQYSIETQKVKRAQGTLNILSNSRRSGETDIVHISDTAQSFCKQSIAALIDKSANTSAQELSFYCSNCSNTSAILEMPLISVKMFLVDIILILKSTV